MDVLNSILILPSKDDPDYQAKIRQEQITSKMVSLIDGREIVPIDNSCIVLSRCEFAKKFGCAGICCSYIYCGGEISGGRVISNINVLPMSLMISRPKFAAQKGCSQKTRKFLREIDRDELYHDLFLVNCKNFKAFTGSRFLTAEQIQLLIQENYLSEFMNPVKDILGLFQSYGRNGQLTKGKLTGIEEPIDHRSKIQKMVYHINWD